MLGVPGWRMLILELTEIRTLRSSLDHPRIVRAILGLSAQRSNPRFVHNIIRYIRGAPNRFKSSDKTMRYLTAFDRHICETSSPTRTCIYFCTEASVWPHKDIEYHKYQHLFKNRYEVAAFQQLQGKQHCKNAPWGSITLVVYNRWHLPLALFIAGWVWHTWKS